MILEALIITKIDYLIHFRNLNLIPQLGGATVDLSLKGPSGSNHGYNFNNSQLVSVDDDDNAENAIITFLEYQVLIGNRKWLKEKNFIEIPQEVEEKMLSQEKLGHTALLVAINGK